MNAYYWNDDTDKIVKDIIRLKPKYVGIVEANQELFDGIKKNMNYRFAYYYPDGPKSVAFFTNESVKEEELLNV